MSALWLSKLRLGTGSRSRRDRPPYNWVRARTSHLFKRTDVAVPVTDGYVDWFTMGVGKEVNKILAGIDAELAAARANLK